MANRLITGRDVVRIVADMRSTRERQRAICSILIATGQLRTGVTLRDITGLIKSIVSRDFISLGLDIVALYSELVNEKAIWNQGF